MRNAPLAADSAPSAAAAARAWIERLIGLRERGESGRAAVRDCADRYHLGGRSERNSDLSPRGSPWPTRPVGRTLIAPPVHARSRATEVFDACVTLQIGGELAAEFPTHRIHAREVEGGFALILDDAVCCEGGAFEVASMFVSMRRSFAERARPSARSGSHLRLRALSNVETIPVSVAAKKNR